MHNSIHQKSYLEYLFLGEINVLTQRLNEVVSKLNLRGEELIEKTQRSQDIEKPIDLKNYELDELENIDISKYK